MQVHTAKIRYHIVRINPTNHLFLYPTEQLGRYLGRLNVYVKKMKTPQMYDQEGVSEHKNDSTVLPILYIIHVYIINWKKFLPLFYYCFKTTISLDQGENIINILVNKSFNNYHQ